MDVSWYELAFVHKTKASRQGGHNERLEFIGDAVLDAVIADWVYDRFGDKPEGYLSKIKSGIVNRKRLNLLARELGLEPFIQARVRNRQAMHVIGGNALEALIGAIFKDRGYDYTRAWVLKMIIPKIDINRLQSKLTDAKSSLYEKAHRHRAELRFEAREFNDEGRPRFETTVLWNGEALATGSGASKKAADQMAARKGLTNLNDQKLGGAKAAE